MNVRPRKIGRGKFFGLNLLTTSIFIGSGLAGIALIGDTPANPLEIFFGIQLLLLAAIAEIYSWAVVWPARLRDVQWPLWLQIGRLIPLISLVLGIGLLIEEHKGDIR